MKIECISIKEEKLPSSRVKCYIDVKLDDKIVICGFKLISSDSGGLFLAFPSRKPTFVCPNCETSNLLGARTRFCRNCLAILDEYKGDIQDLPKYIDIVYTVDKHFFKELEHQLIEEYQKSKAQAEKDRARQKAPPDA